MNKWLMVGIMLLASVLISFVGAVCASLLFAASHPPGLPVSVALSRAALYGGGVFIKLMALCVVIGSGIVSVAALSTS